MNRLRYDERGGVLVVSAFLIPVVLLLTALVIDVGNWYTHDRQLQNRADAAAHAAGVEYANNWKACVSSNAGVRQAEAKLIADAARQYAGDPKAYHYSTGTLPALQNTEIADQSKLDVVINSSDANYTLDTDNTDGGVGVIADPCYNHPPDPTDPISPGGGQWTDVSVKESNLPSLFGSVGLPLSRAGGRARVEIRPALSGHRFLPLAVPNNVITKVQVRYYNECTSPPTLIAKRDLAPLGDQAGLVPTGGGTLWALPKSTPDGPVGDPALTFGLALPNYSPSCGNYLPVGVEVRLASRDEIDIDTPDCDTLLKARYADCFHRLSQIRVWNDGMADNQIRVPRIELSGGCGAPGDAYFSTLPVAETNCKYDATVEVNWGTRSENSTNDPTKFKVSVNGEDADLVTWVSGGVSTYATSGGALTANPVPGANPVTVTATWEDETKGRNWNGDCDKTPSNPCKGSVSDGHQAFVGTTTNSGAVLLVRTSRFDWLNGLPGGPFDNYATGGATIQVHPTVGTRSVLKTGVLTTLRLDDPQSNQSIFCDPSYSQPFPMFQYGCKPWYTANKWKSPWWIGSPKDCPPQGYWYSYTDQGAGFGVNNPTGNAWQCVITAPGIKAGQVGDYMAVATDNCDDIQSNACQVNSFDCNYHGNYDGKPGWKTVGWNTTGGKGDNVSPLENPEKLGSAYPRVVNLFIVPYQAGKGLTGFGDEIPILGFASFYVMNWSGAGPDGKPDAKQNDPCPDETWGGVSIPQPPPGAITGVFVESVDYEPGPVDKTATCYEGMLGQCRATLVR